MGGGVISTMGITDVDLRGSQVRKRKKMCLNQSFIYTHPFPPLSHQSFYLPLFNLVAKRKLLDRKSMEAHDFLLAADAVFQITPMLVTVVC